MLIFLVPVKSAKLASNWGEFSKLVERTLKSICNQDNDNFKVIVACHELPEINYKNDKIEYIQVSFEPPKLIQYDLNKDSLMEDKWMKNRWLKEDDKARKILVAYEKAKSYDPNYVMVVDSDDFINSSIVSFAEKQKSDEPGWYFNKGYFYKEGSKFFVALNIKTFNRFCGSCIIIRTDLLPQLIINNPDLYYVHNSEKLADGTILKPFPFKGAVYSMANGENHFMSSGVALKMISRPNTMANFEIFKSLYKKMKKYRFRIITRGFKRKFHFYHIN